MRRTDRYARTGYGHVRRLLHALLSALVPGTGQIAGGALRRGLVLLTVVVALVLLLVIITMVGWDLVLAWAIQPTVLLALLGANVVFLAFRLYAVLDAYFTGRPRDGEVQPGRRRLSRRRTLSWSRHRAGLRRGRRRRRAVTGRSPAFSPPPRSSSLSS